MARKILSEQQGFSYRSRSQPASPHSSGHYAGIHPEDVPYQSQDFDSDVDQDEEDDDQDGDEEYQPPTRQQYRVPARYRQPATPGRVVTAPRVPSSSRRYNVDMNGYAIQPQPRIQVREEPYRQPAPRKLPKARPRFHPIMYLGIGLFLVIGGYSGLTNLGQWWQQRQDDANYGYPRTYQTDAIVGHTDSQTSPSHFQCINLRGKINVVEAFGGDMTKQIDYPITVQIGNDLAPCTVSFRDINGDGRPDMVVSVGDQPSQSSYFYFNDGKRFSSKP